jgi:hypothetical protein
MGQILSQVQTSETYESLGLAIYEGKDVDKSKLSELGRRIHSDYIAHKVAMEQIGKVCQQHGMTSPEVFLPLVSMGEAEFEATMEERVVILKLIYEGFFAPTMAKLGIPIRYESGISGMRFVLDSNGLPRELVVSMGD